MLEKMWTSFLIGFVYLVFLAWGALILGGATWLSIITWRAVINLF